MSIPSSQSFQKTSADDGARPAGEHTPTKVPVVPTSGQSSQTVLSVTVAPTLICFVLPSLHGAVHVSAPSATLVSALIQDTCSARAAWATAKSCACHGLCEGIVIPPPRRAALQWRNYLQGSHPCGTTCRGATRAVLRSGGRSSGTLAYRFNCSACSAAAVAESLAMGQRTQSLTA